MPVATYNPESDCFNVAAIMSKAWAIYRQYHRNKAFQRKRFAWALEQAWYDAELDRHFAEQAAKRAAQSASERKVADLKAAIEGLDYLPLAQRTSERRAALQAELAQLREVA